MTDYRTVRLLLAQHKVDSDLIGAEGGHRCMIGGIYVGMEDGVSLGRFDILNKYAIRSRKIKLLFFLQLQKNFQID